MKAQTFNLGEFREKKLPKEDEIRSHWADKCSSPFVSILCHTYNHVEYIEDAIKGFLIQETRYPFEIIIHDDHSLDGTTEVVNGYANNYPNIIKLIKQKENQYKLGRKPIEFTTPIAKGKYLALCEGDDFWISSNKIDLQIYLLESHKDINISFHSSLLGYPQSAEESFKVNRLGRELGGVMDFTIVSPEHVIKNNNQAIPTASIVVRKKVFEMLPDWYTTSPAVDFFIQTMALVPAGGLFVNEVMSFYRTFVPGSWSSRTQSDFSEHYYKQKRNMERLFDHLDSRFHPALKENFSRLALHAAANSFHRGCYEDFKERISTSVSMKFPYSFRQVLFFIISWSSLASESMLFFLKLKRRLYCNLKR